MAEVGKYNKLEVLRRAEQGVYLAGAKENDILLPNAYVPEPCGIGDEVEVFVYRDSEDRIIATTLKPTATVGEFAYLKVVASTPVGAFLDWGLPKDLLVPFKEQRERMATGLAYVVYIFVDEETDRVVATSKFNRFLSKEPPDLVPGQEVDLLIFRHTHLGLEAIINSKWKGMIFENEIFRALHPGDKVKGFVKQLRPDGKVDLVLQKSGFENIDPVVEKVLDFIKSQGGSTDVTDKSPAKVIYAKLGISKRAFKQAVGQLYKKRLVTVGNDKISLV